MGFLPSPLDIVKFWRDRKSNRQETVSAYLDAVAVEARTLATEWNTFANGLEQELGKQHRTAGYIPEALLSSGIITIPNPAYYSVQLHYRNLSSVIGGLVSESVTTDAVNALAAIIKARSELVEVLMSACEMMRADKQISSEAVNKAKLALAALHHEAAELGLLAAKYKAMSSK